MGRSAFKRKAFYRIAIRHAALEQDFEVALLRLTRETELSKINAQASWTAAGAGRKAAREESPGSIGQE